MKYSELRETIQTGDLLAWSEGGKWNSWRNIQLNLVRMGTMSDYNHVGVAYVVSGRVFVVEAVVPYVRIYPLSKLLPFYYIRTNFRTTDATEEKLLQYIGTPYSKWEAIKAAFTKDTNNTKVMQCAKLVNDLFTEFDIGYKGINDTPEAVVNYTLDNSNSPINYIKE
jgi:hypothetical protein